MNDEWTEAQAGIQLGMQGEIDALKAELAAARADAERLRGLARNLVGVWRGGTRYEQISRAVADFEAALGEHETAGKGGAA